MEEAWTVRDVYLLTEGDEGPIAVPHLELTFMDKGLELDKPNAEAVWNTAWSELEEMSPVERSVLPDGSEGVVMLVVERSGRRRHSLVLATSDAAATEAAIRGRARAHGVETNRSRRAASRALNVVIVLVAAVVMTALLLQAAHVIHF
ncbi:MAG TPA: hypothetical protein VN886_15940 [Acidimicrobiales bacterium]|nr:hypothetical protein [Acidimicrobiales bacterium]